MPLQNTKTEYGTVTKIFHWTIALLVITLLIVGLTMGELKDMSLKITVINLHKSLGITVLFLILCRFAWHLVSKRPEPVAGLTAWEKRLSRLLHDAFYLLLVAMPLTGWMLSSSFGRPVHVFGLPALPDLVPKDPAAGKIFASRHELIGYIIMGAVALHVAAALKHHFIDKDDVLRRMLPVILFCITLLLPLPALAVQQWNVIHEKSSISFHPKQMGTPFDGAFDRFPTTIFFDPDHLSDSKVTAEIDITSAHTGAPDRDDNMKGKDWFDAKQFPTAKFESKSIRKTGENAYEAEGTLTIRDVAVPVTLPFKLVISKNEAGDVSAVMDGSITLDRSKFKLGVGQWADTSLVANEVPVDIHLYALANK
jgi:cytochrome b561